MKCAACGYSEAVGAVPLESLVRDGDMIPMGKAKFIEIRGVFIAPFFTRFVLNSGQSESGTATKVYSCPNCGTVKMEVK